MIRIEDYKHNNEYRESFHRLLRLVFKIDFEEWYQQGFWDDRYVCHSVVSDSQVVANVSVTKMDLILNGNGTKAIQIGTVMTHPEFRGQGLSRMLMDDVLKKYGQDYDLIFLFANQSVLDFYPKYGFTSVPESQFKLELGRSLRKPNAPLRKLDISHKQDLELIKKMVQSRKPISMRFGVTNNFGLFMFYALYVFKDCLFYSEKDQAVVIYQQKEDTLHLYEVLSAGDVDLDGLLSRISGGALNIRFHFTPDQLTGNAQHVPMDHNADVLFVKPNANLGDVPFCAPLLAHA